MESALGMVEFKNIAMGITITDTMVKTSNVRILKSFITHPGKYITVLYGKLSAMNAAIEKSLEYKELILDHFILGNPHESIQKAFDGDYDLKLEEALGIIEASNIPSLIEATDMIVKTARCTILEIKIKKELGGKAVVLFTGELAAVEASTKAAVRFVSEKDMLISHSIIPNPDKMIWEMLKQA